MARRGTFQKLRPLSLLEHLSSCYDNAYLQIFSNSVSWSVYLEQGKVIYASHSVDPFERLERHLRRLDSQDSINCFDIETLTQLRLIFDTGLENQLIQNPDYEAICWLVNQQYLNPKQAATLIEELVKEVIETFLLVKAGTYEFRYQLDTVPKLCRLDLPPLVEYCQKQLQGWQSLGPQIWSPYQRPYFLTRDRDQQQLLPEPHQKFSTILKGFSFRRLAVLLNQNELQLAQSLHPYIMKGIVLLYEPLSPFDQLPRTFDQLPEPLEQLEDSFKQLARIPPQASESVQNLDRRNGSATDQSLDLLNYSVKPVENLEKLNGVNTETRTASHLAEIEDAPVAEKVYTIVCVDDSPTILQEIRYFLDDENFSVFTVNDPVKALMQIVRHKPDLILLDVRMANIDGYELCRLLRNHSLFKQTPIIMVTGNTGIIDRVKARIVGASSYLTKPFTKSDLLKIIFKYLT